jgi:hypothetical protein
MANPSAPSYGEIEITETKDTILTGKDDKQTLT